MLRQAGTWDPLPSSACTWTNVSFSNKVQRNYKGLKITAHMQLGQIRVTGCKKTKNPAATSEELGAKSRLLCIPPALSTKGVGKPPKPPLWPNSGTHPYPHGRNQLVAPLQERVSKQTKLWLVLAPHSAAGASVKPCLNFLSGPLSISFG